MYRDAAEGWLVHIPFYSKCHFIPKSPEGSFQDISGSVQFGHGISSLRLYSTQLSLITEVLYDIYIIFGHLLLTLLLGPSHLSYQILFPGGFKCHSGAYELP